MKKHTKITHITVWRTIVQLLFFVLLPGLYVNAFVGIKIIYQGILAHNLDLAKSFPQLVSAAAIIPVTMLFGRFFCGFMCAFGTLGDFLYYISRKVFKIKVKIDEETDAALKYIKYALLFFIVVVVWTIKAFNISSLSPWDAFGSLLTFTSLPDFSYVIKEVTVGFLLLIAIMIGSLFVERFFCRYLCPLGAVFSVLSHLKFIRIRMPKKDCGNCKACTRKCSMGIPLYKMDYVTSGECINCMKCVNVCPRDNVTVHAVTVTASPALTSALAVTTMAGVYYIGSFVSDADAMKSGSLTASQASVQNSSMYADGTYEGSGTGFRGATTTVSVTVKGGIITDIQAVSFGDDRPYFSSAFSTIVNQIISGQSTDVDTVSGATFSSNGIITAVKNALNHTNQAAASEATITPAQEASAAPTSAAATKNNTTAKSSGTATNNSKTETSASGNSDNTGVTAQKYKDGTYEGSGNGYRRGITKVAVTVKSDKIIDIQILSTQDDAPFFNSACNTIISEILSSQSANVDTVSGATFSSNGIMTAVADALNNAENA